MKSTLVDLNKVNKGIALLDEKMPDWYTHIRILDLEMSEPKYCICGQLGPVIEPDGDMITTLDLLGIRDIKYPMSENGFDISFDAARLGEDEAYAYLKELWVEAINERLSR